MMRAIVFFAIGAGACYLYLHPGDVDGMMQMGKDSINSGASIIKEMTDD